MSLETFLVGQPATVQGDGYHLIQLPFHREPVIVFDYPRLVGEVFAAANYAALHGGAVPPTAFWARVMESFQADPALFVATHQCPIFLSVVLRAAEAGQPVTPTKPVPTKPIADQPAPTPGIPLIPPPPPITIVAPPKPPVVTPGVGPFPIDLPEPVLVPEPATGFVMGAMLVVCLAWRKLHGPAR